MNTLQRIEVWIKESAEHRLIAFAVAGGLIALVSIAKSRTSPTTSNTLSPASGGSATSDDLLSAITKLGDEISGVQTSVGSGAGANIHVNYERDNSTEQDTTSSSGSGFNLGFNGFSLGFGSNNSNTSTNITHDTFSQDTTAENLTDSELDKLYAFLKSVDPLTALSYQAALPTVHNAAVKRGLIKGTPGAIGGSFVVTSSVSKNVNGMPASSWRIGAS